MRVCSFKRCKNSSKNNMGMSFFFYPKKCPDLYRIWTELSGYVKGSKYATVCEAHFHPEDLETDDSGRKKWPTSGAIPNWKGSTNHQLVGKTGGTKCTLCTVCPGSSDPPEKNIIIYLHQKIRFTPFLTIMIF